MSSYSSLQWTQAQDDDIPLISRTSLLRPSPRSDTSPAPKDSGLYSNPLVPGWPTCPQSLRKTTSEICLNVAIETLLILFSLSLLALAIAVVYYEDEVVVESEWRVFKQIINSVGTAFPYVFALVVGRAVKLFAAWRLEQGISLGVLEQIIGSSTLGGLLTTHSLLRPFNLASLGLFTLWIFSPVGSRVSLGLIEPRYRPVVSNAAVQYLDTAQQSKFYSEVPEETEEVIAGPIASVYSSSLMTPDAFKNSSMDIWGNVKIPYYSRLPEPIVADASGWTQVSESRDIVYSSFIGIPMSKNNTRGANTTWTMTTTYLELNCFNITKSLNIPAYKESDGITWRRLGGPTSFTVAINGFISPSTSPESSRSVSAFINATNSSSIPHTLLFQSVIWENSSGITNSTIMATAYCDLSQTYVDVEVLCRTEDCRVTAMRPSESPHAPENFTVFGFEHGFHVFSWLLPLATGENLMGTLPQSTAAELYISGITSSPSSKLSKVDLSLVSKDDMERRLGQILNTFYLATLAPYGLTGNLTEGNASTIRTSAVGTTWVSRYYVNEMWLSLYFISCSVLLMAVACGVVLNMMVVAPEILGFMSTLTRDNPHVRIPGGGTAMSGIQRSRLLKDVRIKLGDIREERDGVGYIAITSEQGTVKLRKDMLYS